jgi:hypothetical protein
MVPTLAARSMRPPRVAATMEVFETACVDGLVRVTAEASRKG